MAISEERFALALERLDADDWASFEKLASTFLATEFGTLRTLANPSGDGGRDAVLFSTDEEPQTVFQYSVTPDWKTKIRSTIRRLEEKSSKITLLIYVSNQRIGADADALKKELRKKGYQLDIRDKSYFLERANADNARSAASEELAAIIVDPLLAKRGLIASSGVMSHEEANTALLYIEMQQQDEILAKGLTRSCFEALVKAALQGSDKDNRVERTVIYNRIQAYLPQHSADTLKKFIDAALTRLKRNAISQWAGKSEDEFHISFQEATRLQEVSARLMKMRQAFENDVRDIFNISGSINPDNIAEAIEAVHKIVQIHFLKRGEAFASAVARNNYKELDVRDLRTIVQQHFPLKLVKEQDSTSFAVSCVNNLLTTPSDDTKSYLSNLSDSYTLMSFLSATPDVQAATNKLFNQATIWLDTGVVLPIIGETAEVDSEKPFTTLFRQARAAGARLYISTGVIEEIERHLNLCRTYASKSYDRWEGSVPYVYARYIFAGGSENGFSSWLENFMGSNDPVEDLAEYLREDYGIIVEQEIPVGDVSDDQRNSLMQYWRQVHEQRRNVVGKHYNMNIDRLAKHDVDSCMMVLTERARYRRAERIGQASWWFTLDKAASRMPASSILADYKEALSSVVMSTDFLMRYIAFGPGRDRIAPLERSQLRIFASPLMEVIPQEVIKTAVAIRKIHYLEQERKIKRRLRDALDVERRKVGPLQEAGLDGMKEALLAGY